jgi:hypothetical protein
MFSMRQKLSNGSLLAQGLRPYQAMAGQLAMAQPFSVLPLSYRMFAKFERNKPHLNVGTIGKFTKVPAISCDAPASNFFGESLTQLCSLL